MFKEESSYKTVEASNANHCLSHEFIPHVVEDATHISPESDEYHFGIWSHEAIDIIDLDSLEKYTVASPCHCSSDDPSKER